MFKRLLRTISYSTKQTKKKGICDNRDVYENNKMQKSNEDIKYTLEIFMFNFKQQLVT